MPTFMVTVDWAHPYAGRPELGTADVKEVLDGLWCSPDCETARLSTDSIVEVPNP